ncbi:hypothetical protein FKM82_023366 [Ascaphus truei]
MKNKVDMQSSEATYRTGEVSEATYRTGQVPGATYRTGEVSEATYRTGQVPGATYRTGEVSEATYRTGEESRVEQSSDRFSSDDIFSKNTGNRTIYQPDKQRPVVSYRGAHFENETRPRSLNYAPSSSQDRLSYNPSFVKVSPVSPPNYENVMPARAREGAPSGWSRTQNIRPPTIENFLGSRDSVDFSKVIAVLQR